MEFEPELKEITLLRKERINTKLIDFNTKINNELLTLISEIDNLIKVKKVKLTKNKSDELNKIKSDFNKDDEYTNDGYVNKKEYINTLEQIKNFVNKQETKVKKERVVKERVKKNKPSIKDDIISLINTIDELLKNDKKIKLTKIKTNLLSLIKSLSLDEINNSELKKYYNKLLTIQKYINKKNSS